MSGGGRSPYLDWHAVTDPIASEALEALLTSERMAKRWSGLSSDARDLLRRILSTMLQEGAAAQMEAFDGFRALDELRGRDLVFVDQGRLGAYPFAASESGHRVTTRHASYWAVCAIDAFGIAAVVGAPSRVETRCPQCDGAVVFEVSGHAIGSTPNTAMVWAGVQETGGCAATTQCRTMRAFCSEVHLNAWVGETKGFRLSPDQAAELGAAIFGRGSAYEAVLAAV